MEKSSDSGNYDDFLADLPADTCRYAIYDFEYEKAGEGKRNKICFYAWFVIPPPRLLHASRSSD